jgi:isopenicillin N synthase-like dioxygenase
MSHIAEGLGKPIDYFNQWFINNTCSTFRIIRYLPRSTKLVDMDKLSEDELRFTTPIHTDSGFLTLLSTFSYPGLQVDIGGGVYKSVRPVAKTLVVNLGDMLSRITDYKLKATKHRVLDIGVERFSSPFFFEPHYAARIPSSLGSQSVDSNEEFVYGDWVIEKMREFGEFKHF